MIPIIKRQGARFENITDVVSDKAIDKMDFDLAVVISKKILEHYPGYGWKIDVDSRYGKITILCGQIQAALSGNFPYQFFIPMPKLVNHKDLVHKVVMGAGEMLERAKLPRGKWDGEFPKKVDGVKDKHQPKGII